MPDHSTGSSEADTGEAPEGADIAGMPPRDEPASGTIALVVAVLIPVAGIVLGAIGLKKARTQRNKVLSGIALGFGIAWVAAIGVAALSLQSSSSSTPAASSMSFFVGQTDLQNALTSKTRARLASATLTAGEAVTPFACIGPINATSASQTWSCSTTLIAGGVSAPQTVTVTAYPDGSWISRGG